MRGVYIGGAAVLGAAALLLPPLAGAAAARVIEVEATDTNFFNTRFEPWEVNATNADVVRVTNTGSDRHTFTNASGVWQELDLAAGETGTVTVRPDGDYRFYCRYHASARAEPGQGMAGILRVRNASAPPEDDESSSPSVENTGSKRQPAPEIALSSLVAVAAALLRRRS